MLSFYDVILRDVVLVSVLSIVFGFIYSHFPDDFGFKDSFDPYYFSFTTMSSVGYGDFLPTTKRSKIIVMVQHFIVMTSIMAFAIEFLLITGFGRNKKGVNSIKSKKRSGSFYV